MHFQIRVSLCLVIRLASRSVESTSSCSPESQSRYNLKFLQVASHSRLPSLLHIQLGTMAMFQRDPRAGAFLGGDRVSGQDIRDQNGM